jgi:hypothetical protein
MGYSNAGGPPSLFLTVSHLVAMFAPETALLGRKSRKGQRLRRFQDRAGSLADCLVSCSGDAGETRLAARDVGKLEFADGEATGLFSRAGLVEHVSSEAGLLEIVIRGQRLC